ncbi:MAG: primosomal protein N' [Eubacteriaceae bacterium]|nr:primosomal protein N' [Eubacteriaceae bacterium]
MKIAEVFLNQKNKRIDQAYDYVVPENLEKKVRMGMRVVVPFGFGNRRIEGFVTGVKKNSDYTGKMKEVLECIDKEPILLKEQVELCLWMKSYYCSLFYESLSYFTASVKAIREIEYHQTQEKDPESLTGNWFITYYFKNKNQVLKDKNVEKKDRHILEELLTLGILYPMNTWRTASDKEEFCYTLTELGKGALEKEKGLGANQRRLLEFLNQKDMTDALIKVFPENLKSSLKTLIKKDYVSVDQIKQQSLGNIILKRKSACFPEIILAENEKKWHRETQDLVNEKKEILFHVFDGASKYRLFFKSIEENLRKDKGVIVLFPEINITFQRMEMFYKYFGDQVGVFHGRLTQKERYNLVQKIRNGQIRIIIGVRAALFLPMENLGLIIIDDEHDPSYVSMAAPRFHATTIARKYCELTGASLILGDDMPRISTWYKTKKGRMNVIKIGEAPEVQKPIEVIDMQNEIHQGNMGFFSRRLIELLKSGLYQQSLSVLFINKKGYANCVFCRACGHVEKCPHCGIALKYFEGGQLLNCHYCGYQKKIPLQCPTCGSDQIRHMGFGIDQVEALLSKGFPEARVLNVQGNLKPTEIKKINEELLKGQIDILIGTQIIIKHFDLSKAGLAAALLIDSDLNQGDYRSAENVYQTYGRFFGKTIKGDTIGLIQTNDPENDTIYSIVHENYEDFYEGEINYREIMKYPPIMNMIVYGVFQDNAKEAESDAIKLYLALKTNLKETQDSQYFRIFKPISIGAISGGNQKYQIILKINDLKTFRKIMSEIIESGTIEKLKSKVSIEINP